MKLILAAILVATLLLTVSASAQSAQDFNGIRIGDAFTKHESKFEKSPSDSDLLRYKGKTFQFKEKPCYLAQIQFDLMAIGVKSGSIDHIYYWRRTKESEISALRKAATESLTQRYLPSKVIMAEKSKGPKFYERVWSDTDHELILKTVIEGSDPSIDRWATIEILINKREPNHK